MINLSDLTSGSSSTNDARIALQSAATTSPLFSPSTWTSIAFNIIPININNTITSFTPGASAFSLAAGSYQAIFTHCVLIDSGDSTVSVNKRLYNNTTAAEITRGTQAIYNNTGTVNYNNTNFIRDNFYFTLASTASISLQFIHNRASNDFRLRYGHAATVFDNLNTAYTLDVFKLK